MITIDRTYRLVEVARAGCSPMSCSVPQPKFALVPTVHHQKAPRILAA